MSKAKNQGLKHFSNIHKFDSMDNNYWTKRREQQEVMRIANEKDLHFYNVVLDLVGKMHDQVLELGAIDPFKGGGFKRGKRPNITWERVEGHEHLLKDYFVENPIDDAKIFCQRLRMSKRLFFKIIENVEKDDSYFVQKLDAINQLGLSGLQKCMATLNILAFGIASDATNEYVRLASRTSKKVLKSLF